MPTRWGVVMRVRYAEDDHATRLPRAFLLAVHYMDGCRAEGARETARGDAPLPRWERDVELWLRQCGLWISERVALWRGKQAAQTHRETES